MSRHIKTWLVLSLVVVGWFFWQQGCDAPMDDIVIADGAVTVRNQSADDWVDIRIWVNEHYAGTAVSIPAGGFVREPLSRFVTSRAQKFDAVIMPVASVVVLAKTPAGAPVRIIWGKPFWH
jgi:hypothetical protein